MQGVIFGLYAFLLGNVGQIFFGILYGDPFKIKDLAAGKDGGNDLVLLGGSKYEDRVLWWLFQGLQKGVKSSLRKHVHLINDVDLVLSYLWRNTYLVYQVSNIIHRVIGSGIQFKDVEGKIFIGILIPVLVDLLGQDTGAGSFTYSPRTGKKQGLCQVIMFNGIEQRVGYSLLAHNVFEGLRAVFPCRYYKMFH